jgi:hypothetical protein
MVLIEPKNNVFVQIGGTKKLHSPNAHGTSKFSTGGAAGVRAVGLFSSTYFGEISIFGLSKDQIFRK